MGLINRLRKLNSRTSLSLGKMQIGGLSLAFILIIGFGWMFIRHKLDLTPKTYELVNEIVGLAIATLFVSIVVVKLSRLSPRNRWAMVCIFGCASLVGVLVGVLLNLNEEHRGLSEYFPYDVILYFVAAVGGYILYRMHTARLRRIQLERQARAMRKRRNAV